jgi:hypothetical protein
VGNAVQEQRRVASMSAGDLAETYASQNTNPYYLTSLYHVATSLRCHEAQILKEVRCQVQMEQVIKHYKHKIRVYCHKLPLDINYPCLITYRAVLTYKHNYTHTYKDYNIRIDYRITEKKYRVFTPYIVAKVTCHNCICLL